MKIKQSAIDISAILDLEELKKVFKHFSVTTGLDVALFDSCGKEKLAYRQSDHSFCALANGNVKCCDAIVYGGKKSAELGEPYIYSCGCGLIMCASPVLFGDDILGSIACGPVVLWEPDELALDEFELKNADLNIDKNKLDEFLKGTPRLSCVNLTSAAQVLFILVNHMIRDQSKFLKQRSEISAQQARIAELLSEKKQTAASVDVLEKTASLNKYPLQLEKELIAFVQMGDTVSAKRILNSLLSEVFSLSSGNMETMRARLIELSAFLSRAAVDAGAPLSEIDSIIRKSTENFVNESDFEKLCYNSCEVMEQFIEAVYNHRAKKATSQHLSKAISYINANYAYDVTLENVAKSVFVSGFYLSHLFREEMNMTFSDYVAQVRIERAKELLKNKKLKIQEVAESVGFADSNYFAKTFKKLCGVNPRQYQSIFC